MSHKLPDKESSRMSMYRKTGILAGVLIIAIALASLLIMREHNKTAAIQAAQTAQQSARVTPKSPIEVLLSSDKASYTYGDTITFKSSIRNVSATPHTYTFNTTCTQGKLYINRQQTQLGRVCGDAITHVNLKPDESRRYTYAFKVVREFSKPVEGNVIESRGEVLLHPGKYQAYLEWQKDTSSKVDFSVTE